MLGGKYIVLVEDNPDDAALTMRAFSKSTLVNEVRWFADGVEVLEYLHGTGRYAHRDASVLPEVILLDVKLPRMNGLEVLAQLRAHPATKYVPVVMLTTSQEQDDLVRSYSLGANSYIRKPVDFTKFLDVVQTIGVYWLELNQAAH